MKDHPNMIFLVTEIGCGLAGYKPKDIAPLFKGVENLKNVKLPERFWHKIILFINKHTAMKKIEIRFFFIRRWSEIII